MEAILQNANLKRALIKTPKNCIDFTHNSYLNLHKNEQVIAKAKEYIDKFSTSFTTSPLVGNSQIFDEITQKFYDVYQKNMTIFPSGYQANISIIPRIIDLFENPLVICDKLNHNSIYNGLFLAKKHELKRYKNCDLNALENILKQNKDRQKIVITESVFSMDGSLIDIENFVFLKNKYNFFAYIDEAHSIGIFGENGYGISYKYRDQIEVIMATFSKALASQGGFCLTSSELSHYLINKSQGLIYSTGLSPANVGAALKSFELLPHLNEKRNIIFNNISIINKELNTKYKTQIIPIIFENEEMTKTKHKELINAGIFTSFIDKPTVLTPRIRICLNSLHTEDDIKELIKVLK